MKRMLSLILAALLLFSCLSLAPLAASQTAGDMDGDGTVSSDDAIYLLRHTLLPDMFVITQDGNVDGSGEVDSDDAIYLLRHTLLPQMFPLYSQSTPTPPDTEEDGGFIAPTADAKTQQTLTYKVTSDRELTMLYYPPKGTVTGKVPVFFLIPGGGWTSASASAMYNFCKAANEDIRKKGVALVSIEYRVFPEEGVTMETVISDVMDACRYLSHFSDELAVDADKIITCGHSAGGQLALMAALCDHAEYTEDSPFDPIADDFSVIGAVPLSPVTVLYENENGTPPLSFPIDYLFEASADPDADAIKYSPITHLSESSVPIHLQYGTMDDLVYPENAIAFAEKAESLGVSIEVVAAQNGGHSFEPMTPGVSVSPGNPVRHDKIVRFVRTLLGL